MTVEMFEQVGPAHHRLGRVYHSFPEDPTMGMYVTLVEVVGNQVKVGTPLSCPCPMSIIEVQAITQLLSGRIPRLLGAPVDTILIVEDQCPRRWDTYDLTWP